MTPPTISPWTMAFARLVVIVAFGAMATVPALPAQAGDSGFVGMQVQAITAEIAATLGLPNEKGVLVRDVAIGGPAARAGIRHGDLLVRLGDVDIETLESLLKVVAATKANQKLSATVVRHGKPVELSFVPSEWPAGRKVERDAMAIASDVGLTLVALTPKIRERFQLRWGSVGVLITLVDPVKAKGTGLARGEVITQVNQDDVWLPQQVSDKIREAKSKSRGAVLLLVEGASGFRYVVLKLG